MPSVLVCKGTDISSTKRLTSLVRPTNIHNFSAKSKLFAPFLPLGDGKRYVVSESTECLEQQSGNVIIADDYKKTGAFLASSVPFV